MIWLWITMLGGSEEQKYNDFTSLDDEVPPTSTNTQTLTDTGENTDTGGDHPPNVINFITDGVNCERIARHTKRGAGKCRSNTRQARPRRSTAPSGRGIG